MRCPRCGKNTKSIKVCSECKEKINIVEKKLDDIDDIEQIENLIIKKYKKIKVLGALTLVIIFIIILSVFNKKNDVKSYDEFEKIDDTQYIIIKEGDKYGYINEKGKVIISPVYNEVDEFIGNYAIVKQDSKYKLIDKTGKVKFELDSKNDIQHINEFNIWVINSNLYDSNLKKLNQKNVTVKYCSNGFLSWKNIKKKTAGIMDYKGKITYKYKLKEENSTFNVIAIGVQNDTNDSNKYCTINSDNEKYAIVNCSTGKVILDYAKNFISNENGTYYNIKTNNDYAFVEKIIIINDEIVYRNSNKEIIVYDYKNYYTITNTPERNFLYISKKDGRVSKEQPNIEEFVDDEVTSENIMGIKVYKCDLGYGIKSDNGKKLPCEWNDIKFFDTSITNYLKQKNRYYVIGQKDEKYYIINLDDKKKIAEFNTNNIILTEGSLFIEYIDKENNYKHIYSITSNNSIKIDNDSVISIYKNYFTVKKDNKTEYYNLKLKSIYSVDE